MLSRLLPYLLAAAAAALALSEGRRAEQLQSALTDSETSLSRLVKDNQDLVLALRKQNEKVLSIKSRASAEALRAGEAAGEVIARLPSKLESDRTVLPEPKEVNEWLDSLFSH